ncbi:MAG: DUF6159 family protein [Thermoanaerobaculia bacterium]
MFTALRRSYHIFRESLSVLAKDTELLIFPLLSGIFTILALGGMAFGGYITGFFQRLAASGDHSLQGNLLGYAALFVWYFVSWFIVLFFNVAIIHCARMRLDGGDPTVADGFRASMTHIGRIAAWALISATVGIILRIVAERAKFLGKLIASLLGAAWAIATYFIVPVMIFEKRTLRESISQSTQLIKKTWGESLIAAGGIGAFTMVLVLPSLAMPLIGLAISLPAFLGGLLAMVIYWLVLAIVTSALSGIFRTALYLYASEGRTPEGFNPDYVQHAFAVKAAKGSKQLSPA